MNRCFFASLCAILLLFISPASHAAEFQPVLVWSFAGYQETAADLDYLGTTIQNPSFAQAMGRAISLLTKVQDLKGLDPQRPWGAAISTDGLAVAPVAFFPVTDTRALLESLAPLIGPAEPAADGLWKIGRGVVTGFVREKQGWAYLAQSPETLERLPDPLPTLGALPKTYDWAVRIYPRRIPEALRTMAIDQIRLQIRSGLGQLPGESDPQYALRRRLAERNFTTLEELLTHGEQATLGWSVDRQTHKASLELLVTPMKASPLAGRVAALRPTRTEFGSVGGSAGALVLRAGGSLDDEQVRDISADLEVWRGAISQWIDGLPTISSNQERQVFQELAGAVLDICQSAAGTGRIDVALALEGENAPLTLLAAARIGNGQTSERLTSRLANLAKADSPQYRVKLDASRLGTARVHTVEFTGLGGEQAYQSMFGRDATLYVVLADRRAFVAMGAKALPAIEAALQQQELPMPPLVVSLKFSTLVSSAANLTGDIQLRTILALVGTNLKAADQQVQFSLETTDQGLRARLEAGEGVLRAAALGLSLGAIQLRAGN